MPVNVGPAQHRPFSHAGKLGDIIYALPAIRAMGGGRLRLHPWDGCGMTMDAAQADRIRPLLAAQPYIHDVEFDDAPTGIDLNYFRRFCIGDITLADAHLHYLGFSASERDRAWLVAPEPRRVARVILHRSTRYRNAGFPWPRVLEQYGDHAAMVGSEEEYEAFRREVGRVRYVPTRDLLELAQVIAGSELFIGNQSCPYAIAEGLKVATVQETFPPAANCIFLRPNAVYGVDQSVVLPPLRGEPPRFTARTKLVSTGTSASGSGRPNGCSVPPPTTERRIALIFDSAVRPDTTGIYCLRALRQMATVEHIPPAALPALRPGEYDLYLYIDDGLDYPINPGLGPSAAWAIDTHLNPQRLINRFRGIQHVFAAQRDGVELLRRHGINCRGWLPLACDPEVHGRRDLPKRYDVSFVGHVNCPARQELVSLVSRHFPNSFVGQKFFDEMARTYSASRLVLNLSINRDVNMRVFEALASGTLLLTDALVAEGLPELFGDGTHLVTYEGFDELVAKAGHYLAAAEERERIASRGRAEVLERHTYRHRMARLLDAVLGGHTPRTAPRGSSERAGPPPDPPPPRAVVRSPSSRQTTIVIVVHNQLDYTKACVESVWRHTKGAYQLVIVDNASADGTAEWVASNPTIRSIRNERNKGFAAAVNQGLAARETGDVVLLNNDTLVTEGWLDRMRAALEADERIGIVGPCSNNVPGPQRVVRAGYHDGMVSEVAEELARRNGGSRLDAAVLVGFCQLVRGSVIDQIGLLDEEFGIGTYEDYDYCRRAAAAGYRLVIALDAFVHHVGSVTFRADGVDLPSLLARNEEVFLRRWKRIAPESAGGGESTTSVVVVVHNALEFTRQCLASLWRYTGEQVELVIVDNASTDGTAEYLAELRGATVITNSTNRGYPAAANQGIAASTGREVVLLNNDVVLTPDWLGRLRRALAFAPDVGLVGPCTNYASGPQQILPGYSDPGDAARFAERWWNDHGDEVSTTDRLVGFCLFVRREVVDRIGMLDERFGVGNFDDDDYCLRARSAGFRCVIARGCYVHHYGSRTFAQTGCDYGAVMRANERAFVEKWGSLATGLGGGTTDSMPNSARAAWRPGISLCMIVRDSARTLGACLSSVRPWVDQLVVVDTGSSDDTVRIAAGFGAEVHHFPWCDDFAAARNASLAHARHDVVFWMDSDDTIDADNGERLRALARRTWAPDVLGLVAQVRCPHGGAAGPATATVVDHVKLFRNRPDLRFEGRIHEQILPAIRRAGGDVEFTDLFVTHSGSDQTAEGRRRKRERDLRILSLELRDRPDHSFTLFNLGMTFADAGDHPAAVDHLRRSLAAARADESHVRKAHALLVQAYAASGDHAAAERASRVALEAHPGDPELLFCRGLALHSTGDLGGAEECYRQVLCPPSRPRRFDSVDSGIAGHKALQNLAVVLAELGRYDDAAGCWRRLTVDHPAYAEGWRGLVDCLLAAGEHAAAREACAAMLPDLSVDRLLLLARVAREAGDPQLADESLVRAARLAPENMHVMRERAHHCFETSDLDRALAILLKLAEAEPADGAVHHNLGCVYARLGRAEQAAASLKTSLSLRPGYPATESILQEVCRGLQVESESSAYAAEASSPDSPIEYRSTT